MELDKCAYCDAILPAHHLGCATQKRESVNIKQPRIEDLALSNPLYPTTTMSPLDRQVGGSHYKDLKIQPITYIHANNLPFIEGSIVKYITRWKAKGGVEDLKKCIHYLELLIELAGKK